MEPGGCERWVAFCFTVAVTRDGHRVADGGFNSTACCLSQSDSKQERVSAMKAMNKTIFDVPSVHKLKDLLLGSDLEIVYARQAATQFDRGQLDNASGTSSGIEIACDKDHCVWPPRESSLQEEKRNVLLAENAPAHPTVMSALDRREALLATGALVRVLIGNPQLSKRKEEEEEKERRESESASGDLQGEGVGPLSAWRAQRVRGSLRRFWAQARAFRGERVLYCRPSPWSLAQRL
jgi:hypothetical protein